MQTNMRVLLFLGLSVLIGCGRDEPADADGADTQPAAVQAAASTGTVVVGSIRGTLGDDDRTWSALYMERDGDAGASSIYQTRDMGRRTVHMLSLGGHTGTSLRINESLRVNINTMEPLADCPCSVRNQSIEYWVDASDRYETGEAVVTVDRFEDTGNGEYRASGRFSGTLARLSPGDGRPTGETLPVEGTFDIDRILRKQEGQ